MEDLTYRLTPSQHVEINVALKDSRRQEAEWMREADRAGRQVTVQHHQRMIETIDAILGMLDNAESVAIVVTKQ